MGFQNPGDLRLFRRGPRQDLVGGIRGDGAGRQIEVQYRVDDGGLARVRTDQQVGEGAGVRVVEIDDARVHGPTVVGGMGKL